MDFRNTVVILTSNVGAADMLKGRSLGFASVEGVFGDWSRTEGRLLDEVNAPSVRSFSTVSTTSSSLNLWVGPVAQIVGLMLGAVERQAQEQGWLSPFPTR